MDLIAEQKKRDDDFLEALGEWFSVVHPNDNKTLEAILLLAKATFDPEEIINWFFFDNANFQISDSDGNWLTVDTYEKLYDYMAKEYPFKPKMISRKLFKQIMQLLQEQDDANRKLVKAIDKYIDCQHAIPNDSYHTALVEMTECTFAFYETISYWLYEGCKEITVDGKEMDITTLDGLYDLLCIEFKECGGKPVERNSTPDPNVKAISLDEMFEIMKKQILDGKKPK